METIGRYKMKITSRRLRRIIKEEVDRAIMEKINIPMPGFSDIRNPLEYVKKIAEKQGIPGDLVDRIWNNPVTKTNISMISGWEMGKMAANTKLHKDLEEVFSTSQFQKALKGNVTDREITSLAISIENVLERHDYT
jgi:hypothetical protein